MTPILAFDIETIPDIAGIRRLHALPEFWSRKFRHARFTAVITPWRLTTQMCDESASMTAAAKPFECRMALGTAFTFSTRFSS